MANSNNRNVPPIVAEKLKDSGEYLVPLIIYMQIIHRCVCDTGSSLNLMPQEIATQLMLFRFQETNDKLLLPNGDVITPIRALSRVPIRIRNFVMPTDFVVIDAHRRPDTPLILGRPFLSTVETLVDTSKESIIFRRLGCKFKLADPVDNEFTTLGFQDSDLDENV